MFWKVMQWGGAVAIVMILAVCLVTSQVSGDVTAPPVVQKPAQATPGGKNFNF